MVPAAMSKTQAIFATRRSWRRLHLSEEGDLLDALNLVFMPGVPR
jgi:hypothetical protein